MKKSRLNFAVTHLQNITKSVEFAEGLVAVGLTIYVRNWFFYLHLTENN